jgi:hypothetical protein
MIVYRYAHWLIWAKTDKLKFATMGKSNSMTGNADVQCVTRLSLDCPASGDRHWDGQCPKKTHRYVICIYLYIYITLFEKKKANLCASQHIYEMFPLSSYPFATSTN